MHTKTEVHDAEQFLPCMLTCITRGTQNTLLAGCLGQMQLVLVTEICIAVEGSTAIRVGQPQAGVPWICWKVKG